MLSSVGFLCRLQCRRKHKLASQGECRLSEWPAGEPYVGPAANPRFSDMSDRHDLLMVKDEIKKGANFAAQYRLVEFRTGKGPIGAVVFEVKSGLSFHLPSAVGKGFYIGDSQCLELYGRWQGTVDRDHDGSVPLSFSSTSELLIIRRCVDPGRAERFCSPGTSKEGN
jgi:hypothetical protein